MTKAASRISEEIIDLKKYFFKKLRNNYYTKL